MRRWLGIILIAGAACGLWPLLQKATAITRGSIEFPSAVTYSVIASGTTTGQIIKCSAKAITIQGYPLTVSGNTVSCVNNYGQSVPLTFSVDDGAGGTYLTGSGSSSVLASSTARCYPMSFDAKASTNGAMTMTFKAVSQQSTAGFYVEMYFPVSVTIKNGSGKLGVTCP